MLKTLWGGKEPTKGSKYSAAIDLYAQDDFIMEVGETRIIPLGVCINEDKLKPKHFFKQYRDYNPDLIDSMIEIDEGRYDKFMKSHYLQLEPRSSIRAKGVISCSGIIDIDYKDEIKIILHNFSGEQFTINKHDKIAQIMLKEHQSFLFGIDTEDERVGGLGSTGK